MTTITARRTTRVATTVAAVSIALAVSTASPAAALSPSEPTKTVTASLSDSQHAPPSVDVSVRSTTPMAEVAASARPMKTPRGASAHGALPEATGSPQGYDGAAASGTSTATASGGVLGNLWPLAYNRNPNRQVGKLYFDVKKGVGESWRHCTATLINSENKSTLLTAGHCVYTPDPDRNGVVDGNGYWYEGLAFCPGYENGCKIGWWYPRNISTTDNWYYGVGARHSYDWRDDIAIVVLKPNPTLGYAVTKLGGQGISFNQPTGLFRTALGYPAPDSRWPQYSFTGEDLYYCQGTDTLDTSSTKIWIPCRMTGGSSGGPWVINADSSWLGRVNSVNSHKPYGAEYMEGPYFGNAEANLFAYWRAR